MNNDLRIKIKIDSDNKELLITKGELQKLGGVSSKSAKQADGLASSIKNVAKAFGPLYIAYKAMTSIYNDVFKVGIAYSASMEKSLQTLTIIEGSSQKAAASLEWVEEFAISTPYAFEEVKESFVKLRAYGIDPTTGSLETLGDTAAAMGKPMMAAVEAMADAVVGENERLKEFGIRASKKGNEIKYSWTTASGEMKEAVAQNNAAMIQSTLEAIFNEKYAGAMAAQAKTWDGATSNMGAAWDKLAGGVTEDVFSGTKESLLVLTKTLNDLQDDAEFMEVFSHNANTMSINVVNSIGFMAKAFVGVSSVINTSVTGWRMTISSFDTYFSRVGAAYDYWAARADGNASGMEEAMGRYNKLGDDWKETISDQNNELNALLSGNQKLVDGIDSATMSFEKYTRKSQDVVKANNDMAASTPGGKPSGTAEPYKTTSKDMQQDDSTKYIIDQWKEAYALITPEADRLNDQYLAMYEVVKKIFSTEELNTFFGVWSDKLDDISAKNTGMSDQLKSDLEEYGVESKDWTAGLEGTAKSIANIGNAFADIGQDMRKYSALQKEINASTASEADKKKALANLDSQHNEAQLSYLATAAGAMANMYEEGSKGALALQGIQASLAVAAGITAILTQGEGEPYSAFERILAMAGIVSSYLSTIGESISGGGSTGPSYGSTQASRAQSFSELNYATGAYSDVDFENFKKGLDSATQALEDFGNVGSVVGESLTSLDAFIVSRESDLASMIAERDKRIADAMINPVVVDKIHEAFDPLISSINDEILEAEQERLDILSSTLSEMLDFSRMSIAELQSIVPASFDLAAYNASLDEINRLALKKKTGSITDTDLARLEELTAVGGVWQIGQDYADAIDLISDAMETSTENIKTFNDSFKTQEQLLDDLAKSIGVSTAKTTDELHSLFDLLANDVEGLTDTELKLLTANKAYLDSMAEAEDQRMADMAEAEKQRLADIAEAAKATAAFEKESFDMIEAARAARMSIYEKGEADRLKLAEDYASKLDALYLGTYSPLSMLGQTAYANNIAAAPGNMNNYESSFLALQTAAKSVTRDEDLIISFNHTAAILKEQQKDSTRADIIDAIQSMDEKQLKAFSELSFRLRKLEAAQIETNDTLQAG